MTDVTLAEQLACVEREIVSRQQMYPQWVFDKCMTQKQADRELTCMRAVAETLRGLLYAHIGDIKTEKFGDGAPNDR